MPTDDALTPDCLPEDAAHRLLARAAELDARRATEVELVRLREAAREAGISEAAFEQALRETQGAAAPGPSHGAAAPAARARTDGADAGASPSPWRHVAANVVAFAAFVVVLAVVSRVAGAFGATGAVRPALDVLVGAAGVVLALRLRARATAMLLAVTTAAQAAEWVVRVAFDLHAPGDATARYALILAAYLGVAFGLLAARSRAWRPRGASRPEEPDPVDADPVHDRAPDAARAAWRTWLPRVRPLAGGALAVAILAPAPLASQATTRAAPTALLATGAGTSTTDTAPPRRRSALAAFALGLVLPGSGHVYASEPKRGLATALVYWTGVIVTRGGRRTDAPGRVGGVMTLGALAYSVVDAPLAARRRNARLAVGLAPGAGARAGAARVGIAVAP